MNRSTTLGFLFGILSLTTAASAQAPAESAEKPATAAPATANPGGISLGLRTGFGLPVGRIRSVEYGALPGVPAPDDTVSGHVRGMIPLQLDAGYRISPNLLVGVFFQYGVGLVNTDYMTVCNRISCSAYDYSFGAQAHYHFQPDRSFDPWLGAGVGYEVLGFTESNLDRIDPRSPREVTEGYKGFLLSLQGGADFKPAPNFGIGPFANVSVGYYDVNTYTTETYEGSHDQELSIHAWLNVGVRGQFDL
jgi:hypothetical protein